MFEIVVGLAAAGFLLFTRPGNAMLALGLIGFVGYWALFFVAAMIFAK